MICLPFQSFFSLPSITASPLEITLLYLYHDCLFPIPFNILSSSLPSMHMHLHIHIHTCVGKRTRKGLAVIS